MVPLNNVTAYPLRSAAARQAIHTENLLILAASPGDEELFCGDVVARCCAAGRPPMVMVLSDGLDAAPDDTAGVLHDHVNRLADQVLAGLARLGVAPARVLLAGLACGSVPRSGPGFVAAVRAVRLVMWARDCNAILAPWPGMGRPDAEATSMIAAQVAAETGVIWLEYAAPGAALGPAA